MRNLPLLAPLICCVLATPLRAQEVASPRTLGYLTFGIGPSDKGAIGQLAVTLAAPSGDYTLRWSNAADLDLLGPQEEVNDVALMYGVRTRGARTWTSLGGGPALVWTTDPTCTEPTGFFGCQRYDTNRQTAIGLALQGTAGWAPSRAFGLSATLLGNINSMEPFVGLAVNVNVGRLR